MDREVAVGGERVSVRTQPGGLLAARCRLTWITERTAKYHTATRYYARAFLRRLVRAIDHVAARRISAIVASIIPDACGASLRDVTPWNDCVCLLRDGNNI